MTAVTAAPPSGIGITEVLGIASDVWLALIGEAALPSSVAPPPMPDDAVRASVTIEGPWRGRLQITCPPLTASELSNAVLGQDPGTPVDAEDVIDVLGELANVVGGAVKSLLPGSSALGLPSVSTVPAGDTEADAALVLHVDLSWREMPVCFSLRAMTPHTPVAPSSTDDPLTRGETP